MLSVPIDLMRELKYHILTMKYLRSARDEFWLESGKEKVIERWTRHNLAIIYLNPLNLIFDPTSKSMHHLTRYVHPQNLLSSLKDTRVWCSEDRIILLKCQQISRIFLWYDETCVKKIFAKIGCKAKSAFSQKRAKSPRGVGFFLC